MSLRIISGPRSPAFGSYCRMLDHASGGRYLASIVARDPRLKGRVLDVGCGNHGPDNPHYHDVYKMPAQLDGVDPMPGVENNTWIHRCWHGPFEACDIPENEYDAIVSVMVAEHVDKPELFLAKACRVLKPGGAMFALTPCGIHPFARAVRLVQALKLKSRMITDTLGNDYPAYYRLNTRRAVAACAKKAGFESVEFHHYPNAQWEQYWPRLLKFIPMIYDRTIGCRYEPWFLQFFWRLQRPGAWTGPSLERTPSNKPGVHGDAASPGALSAVAKEEP